MAFSSPGRAIRLSFGFLSSLLIGACATADGEVSARVSALGEEGLPADITCLQIRILRGGEPGLPRTFTVAGLMDRDGNGRPESLISSSELPEFGTPFEIRVTGFATGSSQCGGLDSISADYAGSTGSVRLNAGERRVLDIALYEVGASEALERGEALPPRWLHTSTRLNDDRILIAGGFDSLTSITCPSLLLADECYRANAASDAYIFDVPTGRFFPVEGGMLEARGGHTATLLSDGRVLIAGGAEEAILAISRGTPELPASIRVVPLQGTRAVAHASFEIFDRTDPDLSLDPTRRGFPGRGVFAGPAADPESPGALNQERFLHAAATDRGNRVLLAGGFGGDLGTSTFEVFDLQKPGGEGVYRESGNLQTPRESPSAFVLNGIVWIWGGGDAMANEDLVERWDGGAADVGVTESFALPDPDQNAQLAFIRPNVVANTRQNAALVVGWYGPRCPFEMPNRPAFTGDALARCADPTAERFENILVRDAGDVRVDRFQPSNAIYQAFGASDLRAQGDVAIVTGGLDNDFQTRDNLLGLGFGDSRTVETEFMIRARAFHRSTVAAGGLVVTTGGLTFNGDTVSLASLPAESFTFPQPQ